MPALNGDKVLLPKHRDFALEYMANGYNATEAYRKIYPGNDTSPHAKHSAYRVLHKPPVQEFIRAEQKKILEEKFINADRVLLELAEMAFAEKGDQDYTAQVKLKALDLLQKQMGLQSKNVSVQGEIQQQVVILDDMGAEQENNDSAD